MYVLEVTQSSQAEPVMKYRLFLSQEAVSFASCGCLAFVAYISHTDLHGLPFFLLSPTRSSQIAVPGTIPETTDKTSVLLFINIEKQNPT